MKWTSIQAALPEVYLHAKQMLLHEAVRDEHPRKTWTYSDRMLVCVDGRVTVAILDVD